MTHGREKSDSAIVAVKPTNKAVPTAAEPAEPRAGAKGNARRQSTRRTQGRERVAQALERVRQAARQRKKEKLTALHHHISIDCLRMACLDRAKSRPCGNGGLWREAVVRRYSYPALVDVAWCMRGSSLLQRRRGR
jgi:RNA-directed DNA polymerase